MAELLGEDSARQRVYLQKYGTRSARVAHLIPTGADLATARCERCGRKPVPGWLWLGVRTDEQRRTAADLPLCQLDTADAA